NFDPYGDPPYLVMEYVPGTSLRELIRQRALTVPDAAAVMKQVLAALGHAHANGVVHRDVKPENILIHERAVTEGYGAEGVVRLTDFGLGQANVAEGSILLSTEARDAHRGAGGTHHYMPPEQASGAAVDARADLYACGVVLFELLTGERPAGTEVPSDLNPSVPKHLDDAFRRAYARLERRFASAGDFAAALEAPAAAPAPTPAAAPPAPGESPTQPAPPVAPPYRARRGPRPFVPILILIALAVVVISNTPRDERGRALLSPVAVVVALVAVITTLILRGRARRRAWEREWGEPASFAPPPRRRTRRRRNTSAPDGSWPPPAKKG
ncbi:MAG TPA: protein kinase, partial [Tepidisphaeraceae bacterium]|nr:protein kinase [Tepidisphaeraceae bacterium]